MMGKQDMMPPETAQSAGPAPAAQGTGGASQLVSGIHDSMSKLMQAMSSSGAVDEGDTQQLAQIIQQFEAFVDGLGGKKAAPTGNRPMEAGKAEVMPAM